MGNSGCDRHVATLLAMTEKKKILAITEDEKDTRDDRRENGISYNVKRKRCGNKWMRSPRRCAPRDDRRIKRYSR